MYSDRSMNQLGRQGVAALLILAAIMLITSQSVTVHAVTNYGDTNVEIIQSTLVQQYVVALTKIYVTHPTVMQSVSLYLQYTGSDGSQCLKFGIYADDGSGTPLGQRLVAATQSGYCFLVTQNWGPAWETWQLAPYDYLNITSPGVYWLCTLALQAYGTIYHYSYTGSYGGQYLYSYGYYSYSFPASYTLGFPGVDFPQVDYPPANFARAANFTIVDNNAPFSFFMSGT
jgi:hypothetical protein